MFGKEAEAEVLVAVGDGGVFGIGDEEAGGVAVAGEAEAEFGGCEECGGNESAGGEAEEPGAEPVFLGW